MLELIYSFMEGALTYGIIIVMLIFAWMVCLVNCK